MTNVGTSTIGGVSGSNYSNGVGVGAAYTAALGAVQGNYQVITGTGTAGAISAASNALSQGQALYGTGGTSLTAATTYLTPGVYDAAAALSFAANQTLVLDAKGDTNATFVLRTPAALTFGASDFISLVGGAKAGNVYWIVGAAMTVGANSQIVGRVIARNAITLGAGATVTGHDARKAIHATRATVVRRRGALRPPCREESGCARV